MKLIIKEYLSGLAERNELDALLPDLLSQMGLEVFSRPSIGNRQYGVDIAAYGALEDDIERVYLFSLKSGDLGRKDWNSGSVQDLQPSLDEIRDVYISNHIPIEYKGKPIVICICFGGDLKQEVELNIASYENKYATEALTFSRWSGDKLAGYIEKYLLREELLPENLRSLLRKSLAMIDQPDISFKHFRSLLNLLQRLSKEQDKELLVILRQISICTWILYSWCRNENNLESAFLGSELALLKTWDMCKEIMGKKDKKSKEILSTLHSILLLNNQISRDYLEKCVFPISDNLYALSTAVGGSNPVDVNLKLFDIIGRVSVYGIWVYFQLVQEELKKTESLRPLQVLFVNLQETLKQIINNNPILMTPYKDDQAIDIYLAVLFLMLDRRNFQSIENWLEQICGAVNFLFESNGTYPTNIQNYSELLDHPINSTDEYKESVTQGSILYPYISAFSAVLQAEEIYANVSAIKGSYLKHCTFQMWFPDNESENHMYTNSDHHGAVMVDIDISQKPEEFLAMLLNECKTADHLKDMSAIKTGMWPIIMVACRHYRVPVPIKFLLDIWERSTTSGDGISDQS